MGCNMANYYIIIRTIEAVEVAAESEEQALNIVRSRLPRNIAVELEVAQEIVEVTQPEPVVEVIQLEEPQDAAECQEQAL